jgi:hypothetical protein
MSALGFPILLADLFVLRTLSTCSLLIFILPLGVFVTFRSMSSTSLLATSIASSALS